MMHIDIKQLPKQLLIPSFIYFIPVILIPILTSIAKERGTLEAQLIALSASVTAYKIRFMVATIVAPILVYILTLLGFGIKTKTETPVLNLFGMVSLGIYMAMVTIAYASQYIIFPVLLQSENTEWIVFWYFNLPTSLPYFLNQIGNTFFAIGAMALTFKLFYEDSLYRVVAIFFWLSAAFQLVASVGLTMQNPPLMQSAIISSILTIPAIIILIVIGIQVAYQNGQN